MPRFTEKMKLVVRDNARRDISRAAIELIRNGGLTAFSMDAVANEVGMSRSLLYRYFKDKNDILGTILEMAFSDYIARLEQAAATGTTAADRLHNIAHAQVTDFIHNGNFHRILMFNLRPPKRTTGNTCLMLDAHFKQVRIFEGIIRDGIESGEFRSDMNPADAARMIMGSLHEVCFVNGTSNSDEPINPDPMIKLILKGISKQ